MEVFTSSSSIPKDPVMQFVDAMNGVGGSTNTSATGGAAISAPSSSEVPLPSIGGSSEAAAVVGQQQSSSSGNNPPYGNYNYHIHCNYNNYNQMPPPPPPQYPGHGAYMQQQQQPLPQYPSHGAFMQQQQPLPQYPSHGAFMQQQQQRRQPPPRPYYNYNYVPTLPPPYSPLYPPPYNSYYFNTHTLPPTYPPPPPPPPPSPPMLHLRQKIAKQIDYYFCEDNLAKDEYLRMNMDEEGWVPIALIAGFRRVSQLTNDTKFVLDSLMQFSCNVEVKGDKIRRRGNWKKWLYKPKLPKT